MLSSYLGLAVACPSYFSNPRPNAEDEIAPVKECDFPKAAASGEQPKDGPAGPTLRTTD